MLVILEELGTPYEIKSIRFHDVKQKPFTDVDPNERVPGGDHISFLFIFSSVRGSETAV